MHTRFRTALTLSAVVCLVTAGCSSDDDTSAAPATEVTATTATQSATSAPAPTAAPTTVAPTTTASPTTTAPPPVDPRVAFDAFVQPESMGSANPFVTTVDSSGGLFASVVDDPSCQPIRILLDSDDPNLAGWRSYDYAEPPAEANINIAAADPALVAAVVNAHRLELEAVTSCQERTLQDFIDQPTVTLEPVGVTELPGLGVEAVWVESSFSLPEFGLENLRTVTIVMGYGPLASSAVLPEVSIAEIEAIAADLAARLIAAVDG